MKIETKKFFTSTFLISLGATLTFPHQALPSASTNGEEESFDVIRVQLRPLNESNTNAPRTFTIVRASDQDQMGSATAVVSCDAARSTLKSGDESFRFSSDLNCEKLVQVNDGRCDQIVTVNLKDKLVTFAPTPCPKRHEVERRTDIKTELDRDLEEAGIVQRDSVDEGFLFRKEIQNQEPSKNESLGHSRSSEAVRTKQSRSP